MNTVTFNIYEGTSATVMASCVIENGIAQNIKLITKVPRGQYYSFLNDARIEAERLAGKTKR